MSRGGQLTVTMYGTVDNLIYTYDPNKINQLSSISDASSSTQGFRSGTAGSYTYDYNACPPPLNNNFKWRGNMTSDASKNITAITYNHLNLPRTFTFNSLPA